MLKIEGPQLIGCFKASEESGVRSEA